jgi:hypothetical protein
MELIPFLFGTDKQNRVSGLPFKHARSALKQFHKRVWVSQKPYRFVINVQIIKKLFVSLARIRFQ